MPTLSPQTTPYYGGGQVVNPANVIRTSGAPSSVLTEDGLGSLAVDNAAGNIYGLASKSGGVNSWVLLGGSSGAITSVAGTANQITANTAGNAVTLSLPSAITAPGSLTTTTTLTATLGAITATNGNFVGSTAGTGFLFNSPTASGAAASPVVVNGRTGAAVFTSVSIAAAADLTLTITNSAITGSSTQVIYSLSGATTGSALSIKSVTNSSGSSAVVVTNGTGATTNTSNITLTFIVLN